MVMAFYSEAGSGECNGSFEHNKKSLNSVRLTEKFPNSDEHGVALLYPTLTSIVMVVEFYGDAREIQFEHK